jgi:hypothetical protein
VDVLVCSHRHFMHCSSVGSVLSSIRIFFKENYNYDYHDDILGAPWKMFLGVVLLTTIVCVSYCTFVLGFSSLSSIMEFNHNLTSLYQFYVIKQPVIKEVIQTRIEHFQDE